MDKISVIVAVYNIENYIEECLLSLQNQTIDNYEVLVVNDGSKDNSERVIKKFTIDKKFKYLKKKNGGLSSARNYGLDHATGNYVTFVDGDDYVELNFLEELYNTIKKNNTDISVCAFERNYSDKTNYNDVSMNDVIMYRFPAAWNKMYKKDIIDKYNLRFPDGLWYEDLHFSTRALMLSSFSITNKYLYHYRQNDNSIMHTYDDRIFQMYDVLEEITDFAKKNNLYEEQMEQIEFAKVYHILAGTTYRASFHKNFSPKMIKQIFNKVNDENPKWHKNKYIKNLSLIFRVFLFIMSLHQFFLIYIFLKLFNKKFQL